MLYVQKHYFLNAKSSMSVNALAVASLCTCCAAALHYHAKLYTLHRQKYASAYCELHNIIITEKNNNKLQLKMSQNLLNLNKKVSN